MADLLPCPFCGSTNLRYEFAGSQGYIECNECGTEGPCDERAADPYCDDDAACDAWNRRAAALADEPAVPEGREPVAVVEQPKPVPVSERLPGLEDCDADGYCWRWSSIGRLWVRQSLGRRWYDFETYWLPAHALPIPQQQENTDG